MPRASTGTTHPHTYTEVKIKQIFKHEMFPEKQVFSCDRFSASLPMADQRMDISSTISDFMSPGPTDLLSSSLGTSGVDCNRKRKGSSTDYQ